MTAAYGRGETSEDICPGPKSSSFQLISHDTCWALVVGGLLSRMPGTKRVPWPLLLLVGVLPSFQVKTQLLTCTAALSVGFSPREVSISAHNIWVTCVCGQWMGGKESPGAWGMLSEAGRWEQTEMPRWRGKYSTQGAHRTGR